MIKPIDLRIGNYVTVYNQESCPELKQIPFKVVGINMIEGFDKGVWTYNIDLNYIDEQKNIVVPAFSQFIEFIDPIPLTEDILLKCGFEKKEIWNGEVGEIALTYYDYKGKIQISSLLRPVTIEYDRFYMYYGKYISYLHELQNLFYDLTKTELNVQL